MTLEKVFMHQRSNFFDIFLCLHLCNWSKLKNVEKIFQIGRGWLFSGNRHSFRAANCMDLFRRIICFYYSTRGRCELFNDFLINFRALCAVSWRSLYRVRTGTNAAHNLLLHCVIWPFLRELVKCALSVYIKGRARWCQWTSSTRVLPSYSRSFSLFLSFFRNVELFFTTFIERDSRVGLYRA